MKTIEEKAKAYDEAIEKTIKLYSKDIAKTIFPELIESEDEKIRTTLKNALNHLSDNWYHVEDLSKEEVIAWLEKQKEQKVIIPKFRIGDIITSFKNNTIKYFIKKVGVKNELGEYDYIVEDISDDPAYKGRTHEISIEKVDSWGILVRQKPISIWNNTKEVPAPSEKDILGWYRKPNGELEDSPKIVYFCSDEESLKESEDSINLCNLAYWAELPNEEFKKKYWFDKQKPVEWSEKDEKPYPETLEKAIDLYYYTYGNGNGGFNNLSLEKFKDIVKTFIKDYSEQKSVEWSEEDIVAIDCAVEVLNKELPSLAASIERLKNLRPQNTWKPSDEQMEALESACACNILNLDYLDSLYQDLKKLKEK